MNKTVLAVSLAAAAMIAGCGGSGSTPAATTVAGKVADGYLEKATVFLDKNGNYRPDTGEPSTATDANGAYVLAVDPADVGKFPIVALAVAGVTIDRDNPGVPIARSYLLSLPKESVFGNVSSNFISPMSSQIREMMETGSYVSMQQAMEELRVNLGLPPGTSMMGDYLAGGNATMHTAAQNMATVMGEQAAQVFGNGGTSTSIDVNRYRGMMGTMFSNMSSVRATAPQATMTELMETMTSNLGGISIGMPFRNMSSYFRGGMMGAQTMMGGSMMNR